MCWPKRGGALCAEGRGEGRGERRGQRGAPLLSSAGGKGLEVAQASRCGRVQADTSREARKATRALCR